MLALAHLAIDKVALVGVAADGGRTSRGREIVDEVQKIDEHDFGGIRGL
jgi:hypothetical protein